MPKLPENCAKCGQSNIGNRKVEVVWLNTMVCHGDTTHPLGAKCSFCDRVKKEFDDSVSVHGTIAHGTIGGWKICKCKKGKCPYDSNATKIRE